MIWNECIPMKGFEYNNLTFSDNHFLCIQKKKKKRINYLLSLSNAFPSLPFTSLGHYDILSPVITYRELQNYPTISARIPLELENSIKGESICIYMTSSNVREYCFSFQYLIGSRLQSQVADIVSSAKTVLQTLFTKSSDL